MRYLKARKHAILTALVATYFLFLNFILYQWFTQNFSIQSPIVKKQIVSPIPPKTPPGKPQGLTLPSVEKVALAEAPVVAEIESSEAQGLNDAQIAKLIKGKGWDYSIAIRVAKSENFWNLTESFDCVRDNAGTNDDGSIDYGIFEINTVHRPEVEAIYKMPFEEAMTDCERNIDYAYYYLYKTQGWNPWSAWKSGIYLNHTEEL